MDWQLHDRDREIFERELASFVPPRVFDAHLHLYELDHFQGSPPELCASGPPVAGWAEYQRRIAEILPGREIGGLAFPFPATAVNHTAANEFLAQEARAPGALGQMLISPDMDAAFVHDTVQRCGFVGLKPYHLFSREKPTFDAHIPSYLPEAHVRVADELGLSITLHIVRAAALADPSNQDVLRRYARTYPNARFILAHAARGFNPHHTLLGIEALRGLDNVWFDTSVVTDSGALEAIVRVMGHRKLLYGSDFPVTHLRGRCVALGDSFLWLSPANTKLDATYANVQFTLVGSEALRTLKVAAFSCGFSDEQVEDVFYGNAMKLFSRTP